MRYNNYAWEYKVTLSRPTSMKPKILKEDE